MAGFLVDLKQFLIFFNFVKQQLHYIVGDPMFMKTCTRKDIQWGKSDSFYLLELHCVNKMTAVGLASRWFKHDHT